MRICMLVANPIAFDGRVIRHAETLCAAGHEVTVLGVIGPNDQAAPLPAETAFRSWRLDRRRTGLGPRLVWAESALRQRAAMRLVELLSEALVARVPGIAELAVATSAVELCMKALSVPCDVYHGNDLNTLPAVAWAGRLRGRPYVYDAHELYIDEFPDLTRAERIARRVAEGRLCAQAAAVLTVNELIADELVGLHGIRRPVVVRNLPPLVEVPDPGSLPAGRPGSLHLLYHGANVGLPQHGTDDILRAMARVREQMDIRLTIRGGMSGAERAEMLLRIAQLGLGERVRLCPPVSGASALVRAAVLDGAELGLAVHPPLCGSYRFTTSSKVYEYQGAGLAVCATDVAGNHLTVNERAGVFYPYGDDGRLAEIFFQLGHDRDRLRRMRQAARRRAQDELCWEREQQHLLSIYEELAGKRGSR